MLIVTAVAHYLNGGIRVQTPFQRVTPQVKAHLSVLLGVLALVKAAGYYLQQYELDFSTRGTVDGATYTDVNAQLPAIKLLLVISIFAFVLFLVQHLPPRLGAAGARGRAVGVRRRGGGRRSYPAFVQKFRVNPEESTKEEPYIERNIEATQHRDEPRRQRHQVKNFNNDNKPERRRASSTTPRRSATCACGIPMSCSAPTNALQGIRTLLSSSTTSTSTATAQRPHDAGACSRRASSTPRGSRERRG